MDMQNKKSALLPEGMEYCSLCVNYSFLDLPSEEEPARAHQPSLKVLEISAQKCPLCRLIYWAAGCTYHSSMGGYEKEQDIEIPNDEGTGSRKVPAKWTESNRPQFGKRWLDNGTEIQETHPDFQPDTRGLPILGLHRLSESEKEILRPWIFGNWWKNPGQPGEGDKLVGVGVRLGRGPKLEEAELNVGEEKPRLLGTFLRVRVDDRKCLFTLCA
jgi:hypothetical protein